MTKPIDLRKPEPDGVMLQIRVPADYRRFLRIKAEREGRTVSYLVRDALQKVYPMKRGRT